MVGYDWRAVRSRIYRVVSANRAILTQSALEHVNDYIAADEFEMALEGLCLELMHNPGVGLADLQELEVLAKLLGLDKESVYDSDFWTSCTAALETRRRRGSSG